MTPVTAILLIISNYYKNMVKKMASKRGKRKKADERFAHEPTVEPRNGGWYCSLCRQQLQTTKSCKI